MSSSTSSSMSSSQAMTVLKETTMEARSQSSKTYGSSMEETYSRLSTIDAFLDFIAAERLKSMPHRGSTWDRVLAYAGFYGSQIHLYSQSVSAFVPDAQEAARVVWTNLRLLLEHGRLDVLERIFTAYYSLGLAIGALSPWQQHFTSTEIQRTLSVIFSNVVRISIGIAANFGQDGKASVTTIDSKIYRSYGELIESTYYLRDQVIDYMWSASVSVEAGSAEYTFDIEAIRSFLSPSDRIVQSIVSDKAGSKGYRADGSCEWMQKHLVYFTRSKENVFLIQGKPGSGKSYVAKWLLERLQRSEGRSLHHETIFFSVEKDLCTQTSTTAVAKGLLLQVLDGNVGNMDLYYAICDVLEAASKGKPADDVEKLLWRAIEVGLTTLPQTMLVVDGIDALDGGEPSALKLLERLYQVTSKHSHIKSIALGQPLSKAAPQQTRTLTLDASLTNEDIRRYVQGVLSTVPQFSNLSGSDKDNITKRVSTTADGSFIWATYSLELLRREKAVADMTRVLESLPKSLNDIIKRLQSLVDLKASDTRSLLAWLLAAQRPLTLDELKVFFEIDLATCQHTPRSSDVEQDVLHAVGPIVSVIGGIVRFKHETLRTHFMTLSESVKNYSNTGDFPFMIKEAHYDLSTRCLAYIKLFVTRQVEPTFDVPHTTDLQDVFSRSTALEYSSTYWLSHFYQSPMYDPAGKHKLVPEFKHCFPDSVLLPQIESVMWPQMKVDWVELSLTIRRSICGPDTMVTLQTLIYYARMLERVNNYKQSSTYYLQAYTLTRQLLSEDTTLLVRIATSYLLVSGTISITEKNEVATQREDMLKMIIQMFKTEKGASNTVTIKYIRLLAQLYTDTKQYDLAVTVWEELYQIMIERYGVHHSETTTVYKVLETTVSKSSRKDVLTKITERNHESTTRDLDVTDRRRTTAEKDTLSRYIETNDYENAESVMISRWREVSKSASKSSDTTLIKQKLDLTIEYVRFLRQQKRDEEARTVLEGVYAETSTKDIRSQQLATSLQSFAMEMKSMNLTKSARSMFSSLVTYFQSSGQSESSTATIISRELAETNEQIVQQTMTAATSTSTTDESTLIDLFESLTTTSTSTSSARFASIVKVAQQLSIFYVRQQQWTEAYRIASQALSVMWPYMITRQGTVRLPSDFQRECCELALRMGECCWAQRQIENTEDIYVTVWKATKATLKISDELYQIVFQTLSDFYTQTYQYKKYVDLEKQLYEAQKTQMGAANPVTIQTSYRIATYLTKQGKYKEAEPWYYDVYIVLVKGDSIPHEAVPAVESLLTIYYDDARYDSLEKICRTIWQTWTTKKSESRISADIVQKTYESYVYILREIKKVKIEEIYAISKTYYETSRTVFGERNELTLKATLEFASVCEQTETHKQESLAIYESACKHAESLRSTTSTTTSSRLLQTITTARKALARVYVQQASSVSSESASKFMVEQHESTRSTYGMTDTRSLESLTQLVGYNAKQNKTELTQQSVRMLQASVLETITQVTETQTIISTAATLANSYKQINQTETAWALVREIRRQIVTGSYKSDKYSFSMEGFESRAYAFVIAFSQTLRGVSATDSFSEHVADLRTETLLYKTYSRNVRTKAKFDAIFSSGVKLAVFYKSRNRGEEYERTWNELVELFATQMGAQKNSAVLREFFTLVLNEYIEGRYDSRVVDLTVSQIYEKMKASKFVEAYELAVYLDKYVHILGGWRSNSRVESGFQVVLYLSGRSGTPSVTDSKQRSSIIEICRVILSEVLQAARELNVNLLSMPLKQLNDIVALLGEQQNFTDLDWLLTELWQSREQQSSWDSTTIIWIGRRLVETRFAAGRRDAAIHLCEDICYNVRRVWGSSDPVTVEMYDLLGSLHTASGEHAKALAVHEDVCRQTIAAVEEDGDIEPAQGAEVAKNQVELMKRSYQRCGGWGPDKDGSDVKELFGQLQESFGSEKSFSSVQSVDKWSTKEKADDYGVWTKPSTFDFMNVRETQGMKHTNQLRRVSGLVYGTQKNGSMNGHNRNTSASYSYSSSTTTTNGTSKTVTNGKA